MSGVVVIFDFDMTIIDCDSDNWVINDFNSTDRFEALLQTMPWNSAMDKIMSEIHAKGKSIQDIAASLTRAPLHPCTIAAIKSAYSLGCEMRIVSDANLFFIETILKHHGVMDYFSEINTNPIHIDKEKKLRIYPYQQANNFPHGCNSFCPPNMCKGLIMEKIQETVLSEGKKKKRFIYLGDGKGDYCPSLKLGKEDFVMPRKNCPLWELFKKNSDAVLAQVHEWNDAEELERVLMQLIGMAVSGDDKFISMDCKFESLATISACEAVSQALPLKQ